MPAFFLNASPAPGRTPKNPVNRFSKQAMAGAVTAALTGGLLWGALCGVAQADPFASTVLPFVDTYCLDCHGRNKVRGDLDLRPFSSEAAVLKERETWNDIMNALTAFDMPPEESRQPTTSEQAAVVTWIEAALARPDENGVLSPGRPVMRRLTQLEYNNAVRDLLHLDRDPFETSHGFPFGKDYFDPKSGRIPSVFVLDAQQRPDALLKTASLPADRRVEHGFSNRGDGMGMSPLLLEKYIDLSRQIIESPRLLNSGGKRLRHLFKVPGHLNGLAHAESPAGKQETQTARVVFRERLSDILFRAFRRPVTEAELETHVNVAVATYTHARSASAPAPEAFKNAVSQTLVGILASPDFLFRVEPARRVSHGPSAHHTSSHGEHVTANDVADTDHAPVRPLDGFELASRLSFFLWSGPPDLQLLEQAALGNLTNPETLRAETLRMLTDRRVRALSEVFAREWLHLDKLRGVQPDELLFPGFYFGIGNADSLLPALEAESLINFEAVLIEDRSILDLIDTDEIFVNRKLAKHYGYRRDLYTRFRDARRQLGGSNRDNINKSNGIWIRAKAPDRRRGGILTTGAMLTLTSTPRRESPVNRGVWALETLFNRPRPHQPSWCRH